MIDKSNDPFFLSLVIENISEGLCVCHNIDEYPYVRFTLWNKRMTEITGYSIKEINLKGWYQTVYPDPDIQRMAIKRMEEMRQGNGLLDEEWEIIRADGRKRCLCISTSIVKDEDNSTHVMALMRDITEQKLVEKNYLRAERQWTSTVDSASALISVHDMNFRIVRVNKALAEFCGKEPDELIGMYCYEVLHHTETPLHDCPHSKCLGTNQTEHLEVYDPHMAVYMDITCSPITDDKGKTIETVHVIRDITEQKQAATERKSLINKLQDALEEIKTLRGIVPICSYCKQIRDDKGYWSQVEEYVSEHTHAKFSHGICPSCEKKHFSEYVDENGI